MASQLPSALLHSLNQLDHFDAGAFLSVHESGDKLVSVHMNPGKPIFRNGEWMKEITDLPFEISGTVPWSPDAYYLSSRPSFTLDPLFHAGAYYVQEASGMFLSFALKAIINAEKKIKVLDLCAAPGGKSTLIQSLISPESLLVSNEVIKTRVPVLYQNMTQWGSANSIVTNNDPSQFKQISGFFDLLVIDAPCSGSGLFRKDPEAATHWSLDLVKLCSQRQQRILADAWDCLKEDGFLIYCTCSYSKEENEDILDALFLSHNCISVPLHPEPKWNIVETHSDLAGAIGYRFYPDKLSGEGFFLSVIQKKEAAGAKRTNKATKNSLRISKSAEIQIREWIGPETFSFLPVGDSVHVLPTSLVNDFELMKNNFYLKKGGIRAGKAGENEWIPDHELALANVLKNNTPGLDLGKTDALHFLRGESLETNGHERGWRVVRYLGQRIGWIKLLEKRSNNYYPKSWRIRQ